MPTAKALAAESSQGLLDYIDTELAKVEKHLTKLQPLIEHRDKLKAARRPNRRGETSRKHVLDVALRLLASGGPEAVSVKLVAKEADVTWGTVQYQFGDADGSVS